MSNSILQNCVCGLKQYGIMGRPACVKTMEDVYTFIFIPRYNDSNVRNTIDLTSATLGDDISDLILQSAANGSRIYPLPRVYDFDSSSTEPKYDTTTDDTKFKLSGVGEVYSWSGKLKDKDAAFRAYNEIDKTGCGQVDVWVVDKAATIWMAMDNFTYTVARGIGISSSSFTASYEFATAARTNGIPFMFDLESKDEIKRMVAITQEEHGLQLTDFAPLQAVDVALTSVSTTVTTVNVYNPFADVTNPGFVGLVTGNFVFTNENTGLTVSGTTAEDGLGEYTFTAGSAVTSGHVLRCNIQGTGLTKYFFNAATVAVV